ncbi:MAG TPA: DUF58 domain-containing protein [Longimicrobiaceae bacterium]|nr:DUF58 domain-containing protein [Longimicrobiaceae bacterium]
MELRTRKLVNTRFSGDYLSSFKGQGIEFAEVRPYEHGDDVRTIDWNVTARAGEPFVKKFVEERELTVLLVVDLSGSDRWGTRGRLKSQLLAEVATAVSMAAVRNNDRVGLLIVTGEVEAFVRPRKGRRHVLRLLRDLLAFRPARGDTDLAAGLKFAQRILAHRALVFLFSDFQLGDGWDAFGKSLAGFAPRHDVVACRLTDPADFHLPDVGYLRVRDPETGETVVIDTSSRSTRDRFATLLAGDEERARRLFARLGIDEIRLSTDESFAPPLIRFFRRREGRRRR